MSWTSWTSCLRSVRADGRPPSPRQTRYRAMSSIDLTQLLTAQSRVARARGVSSSGSERKENNGRHAATRFLRVQQELHDTRTKPHSSRGREEYVHSTEPRKKTLVRLLAAPIEWTDARQASPWQFDKRGPRPANGSTTEVRNAALHPRRCCATSSGKWMWETDQLLFRTAKRHVLSMQRECVSISN